MLCPIIAKVTANGRGNAARQAEREAAGPESGALSAVPLGQGTAPASSTRTNHPNARKTSDRANKKYPAKFLSLSRKRPHTTASEASPNRIRRRARGSENFAFSQSRSERFSIIQLHPRERVRSQSEENILIRLSGR